MHRLTLFIVFAAVALAQDSPFNRPPAEVDRALRERITAFFQYHVTGDYRKAEAIVAEDTKDYFYTHNKPKYMSFEIGKIDYSDNFTKAKALVLCEQFVMMPGFADKPLKVPTPSAWKLEEGKWMWWVDPDSIGNTPFGKMKPGPMVTAGSGPPISLNSVPTSVDFIYNQVKMETDSVSLKAGEAVTVLLSNGAPGAITLEVQGKLKNVQATLDKTSLRNGEKATLTVKAGEGFEAGTLQVRVEPISQLLPLKITAK